MKIETMLPFGALILPDGESSILDFSPSTLADLALEFQVLIIRGFPTLGETEYISFAKQFGSLLEWEFGEVLNIKLQPNPANHIFSSGRLELHWDGAFVDETPRFNIWQCLQGCEHDGGGETLFVNTVALLQNLDHEERQRWDKLVLQYRTDKKAHYGGSIRESLVSVHPVRKQDRLRFIEPYNEDNEDVNPVEVSIEDYDISEQKVMLCSIINRLYQHDVMYRHKWEEGDFLIADNNAVLHGRSRFTDNRVTRWLQRIHVL